VATKFAIRGLSASLREELHGTNVRVCTVFPGSIDTPLLRQAANFSGRAARPMQPVIPADDVARAVVDLARHPRREVFVGGSGRFFAPVHALFPAASENVIAKKVPREHFADAPAPETPGNLFEPLKFHSVSGGWRDPLNLPSPQKIAACAVGVLILGLLATAALLRK
jgi:hypothetical protein